MSEPLDLALLKERLYVTGWRSSGDRTNDFDALLAEVERLRGELARQAEQITAVRDLAAGVVYVQADRILAALDDAS